MRMKQDFLKTGAVFTRFIAVATVKPVKNKIIEKEKIFRFKQAVV